MMKETKDPEIKLFGKNIALPENGGGDCSGVCGGGGDRENGSGSVSYCCVDVERVSRVGDSEIEKEDEYEADKIGEIEDHCRSKVEENDQCQMAIESKNPEALSVCNNSPETPSTDEDSMAKPSSDNENDQTDTNNSEQKTLKKPDKILPCPRCNSMDTKFCYYNNYNVNQPRHFCKSCQRYWTAGGTMRNVPVGAGRRKNKNSASHCHPITISEALHAARMNASNGFHHPNFKTNGTILSFGPDSPLCGSMASVLSLTDKKVPNGCLNGFYKLDPTASHGEDSSSSLSANPSNPTVQGVKNGHQELVLQHINSFPPQVPYLPGPTWPIPWTSSVPVPAIFPPPGYPLPIYPAPIWNCSIPGAWNFPWLPPLSPQASQNSSGSASTSSSLGKHSRDGEVLKSKDSQDRESQESKESEPSILIPKTLRIDDPEEAAKSSIWTTLGIKYDSMSRGVLFKGLQQKGDEKKNYSTSSQVLQANPAALSRSVTFQERA